MAKRRFFRFILLGLCCLLLSSNAWSKDGKLKDVARPYLGTYECTQLFFAGENLLGRFALFRVELKTDGGSVYYREKKSKSTKTIPFDYEYNSEKKEIWASGQWSVFKVEKCFPLEKGEINVVIPILNTTLKAKFKKR